VERQSVIAIQLSNFIFSQNTTLSNCFQQKNSKKIFSLKNNGCTGLAFVEGGKAVSAAIRVCSSPARAKQGTFQRHSFCQWQTSTT
jgi:hypothetical protein